MNVIIDTHTHIYPCYDAERFLQYTWDNLHALAPDATKCIFLTERVQENYFERIQNSGALGLSKISNTSEEGSLLCELTDKNRIFIVGGKQYLSREGLELLVVGRHEKVTERLPIRELIQTVSHSSPLTILPWSFGKWLFKRKKLVLDLVKDSSLEFLLGDIWGRAHLLGGDDIFSLGKQVQRKILWGTDPLPIAGEEKFTGKLTTLLAGAFNHNLPLGSICEILKGSEERAGTYATPQQAIFRQLLLRVA